MQVWDLLAPGGKQELELAKSIGGFDIPDLTQIGNCPALQPAGPVRRHPATDRASCGHTEADWTQSVTCCRSQHLDRFRLVRDECASVVFYLCCRCGIPGADPGHHGSGL